MNKPINFNLFLVAVLSAFPIIANAQKLPNKQIIGLRTPANIKIDGKATEWNNKFQASNSAIEALYTIANDDDMLYLTIQAQQNDVVDKILRGGITFNINPTLKKKDEQQISVTYPVLGDAGMSGLVNMYARKVHTVTNPDALPITIEDLNKTLELKSKTINIKGIKTIPDEEVSVYNQDGIKAVSRFNNDLAYIYELAIPIKYLALPNNRTNAFSYQIKINEPPEKPSTGQFAPPPPMLITATAATDFWGEYTLAKK